MTQYGPVPTSGNDLSARNNQSTGSLARLVQQPGASMPNVTEDSITFQEIFKGPYNTLKNLPLRQFNGFPRFEVGKERPSAISNDNLFTVRFDPPSPLSSMAWIIDSVDVEEIEPGDHGIMTVNYKQGITDETLGPSGRASEDVDGTTKWGMSFSQESYDIWVYCGPSASHANRPRIEAWMNTEDPDLRRNYMWKLPDVNQVNDLFDNDLKLAQKIEKGIMQVMRHYPILNVSWRATKGKVGSVGTHLDYYTEDPTEHLPDSFFSGTGDQRKIKSARKPPFELPPNRYWLNIADTVQSDGQYITRSMQWIGMEWIDENLYGEDDRWEFASI